MSDNIISMPSACSICSLPKIRLKKLNYLYQAGHPIDEIGLAYSLDTDSLTTHFSTCSLLPEEKIKKENKDKVEFSSKDKYEKLLEEMEEVLDQSYQNLCNYKEDREVNEGEDSPAFKYDQTPKLQTSYAKLVDTYRALIKDIESQRNEEIVVKGIIETIITPLMQSTLKVIIEEIDKVKSELSKQDMLTPELQKSFVEMFRTVGNKTRNEMSDSIDKLYKYYKLDNVNEE